MLGGCLPTRQITLSQIPLFSMETIHGRKTKREFFSLIYIMINDLNNKFKIFFNRKQYCENFDFSHKKPKIDKSRIPH